MSKESVMSVSLLDIEGFEGDPFEELDTIELNGQDTDADEALLASLDERTSDIDQLIDTSYTLESLHSQFQRMDARQVSPSTASVINASLEGILKTKETLLHSHLFKGTASRVEGMRVATEELGERIRVMLQKIIRWIKRVFEVIFDYIEGWIRGANAVQKQAEKLQDIANKVKAKHGDSATSAEVDNAELANFFVNPSNSEGYDAPQIVSEYNKFCATFNESIGSKTAIAGCAYANTKVNEILTKNKTGRFTNEQALAISDETISRMLQNNFSQFTHDTSNGQLTYQAPFGGEQFVITIEEKDGKKAGLSYSTAGEKKKDLKKLTALTPSEVVAMARAVESSMHKGVYRDYKKIKAVMFDFQKSVSDACDQISREQRKTFDGVIPSIHFLKTIASTMFMLIKQVYSYNGRTARAIMKYCHQSLKAYEKAGKKAA
jgi:hypothetical protein